MKVRRHNNCRVLHSTGDTPSALHVCCCQINRWVVVPWVQIGVSTWGAVHLHSMDRWALSGAGVQVLWHARDSVATLRQSLAGWMPARTGRLSVGVGRRHPVTIHKASFMARSMRRLWALHYIYDKTHGLHFFHKFRICFFLCVLKKTNTLHICVAA